MRFVLLAWINIHKSKKGGMVFNARDGGWSSENCQGGINKERHLGTAPGVLVAGPVSAKMCPCVWKCS